MQSAAASVVPLSPNPHQNLFAGLRPTLLFTTTENNQIPKIFFIQFFY